MLMSLFGPTLQFIPLWVAPNVLTLGGFTLLVAQFLALTYYDPAYYASDAGQPEHPPVPPWVWLLSASALFVDLHLGGCIAQCSSA